MTDLVNSELNSVKKFELCRICGEESEHGQVLFHLNQNIQKLAVRICSYISIKLKYVRIYPNWICPGCRLQFESTDQFFDLIRNGQRILSERFGGERKKGRRPKKSRIKQSHETAELTASAEKTDDGGKRSRKAPGRLQDSMKGNELEELYTKMGVSRQSKRSKTKLIAHIEGTDGAMLGDMLAVPQNAQKTSTRFQCDICKETFVKDLSFFKHVLTHKNILYECTECQVNFPSKVTFDEHQVTTNHIGLGIIETPFIESKDENVANNENLDEQVNPPKKPLTTRFVCSKCPKSFSAKTALKRHQIIHSQNRPYKCDVCPAAFKLKTTLSIHKSSHTGDRPFECHKCPKSFTHRQTLKAHLRSHDGLKPYLCTICNKCFTHRGNLQEHKRIHTGERPYVCLICGTSFTTSSQCHTHQRMHAVKKDRPPKPTEFENIQKTHNCKFCGKLFSQRSAMIKHLRTHTGEKPYMCHLCPKTFADPSNFKKHKRMHLVKSEAEKADVLKQSLTRVSSNSDIDPDRLLPVNSVPPNVTTPDKGFLLNILEEDNDRNSEPWGLLRESSDPIITEIHNDDNSLMQQQQPSAANQMVCISYQDPMNPVSSKTTFYVMN